MDKLAGGVYEDSDSDDQDYVPSGGEDSHDGAELSEDERSIPDEDEEEKKRTESLWADFMADVGGPCTKKPRLDKVTAPSSSAETAAASEGGVNSKEQGGASEEDVKKQDSCNVKDQDLTLPGSSSSVVADVEDFHKNDSEKIKVKQVFDFAGEKIEVEKELEKDSKEAKKILAEQAKQKEASQSQKVLIRPKAGGGLSAVVGAVLNKKSKMSIFEKSRLDWNGFKRAEGIEEDLANHNKGKDGYLERVAFLERTDLRQFEIEKALRDKQRSSRAGNL